MPFKKLSQKEAELKTIKLAGSRKIRLTGRYFGIYKKTKFTQDGWGEFETTPICVWYHKTNHPEKALKQRKTVLLSQDEAVKKTEVTRGKDGISLIGEYKGGRTLVLFNQKGYGNFLAKPHCVWRGDTSHPKKGKEIWSEGQKGCLNHSWNPDRNEILGRKKLRVLAKNLIRNTLARTGNKKNDSSLKLVGYSSLELKKWIETRFEKWMNWENSGCYENQWQIDHIIPVSAFIKAGITDLKIINCLHNLKPISAIENARKGDKWDGIDLSSIFKNGMTRIEAEREFKKLCLK